METNDQDYENGDSGILKMMMQYMTATQNATALMNSTLQMFIKNGQLPEMQREEDRSGFLKMTRRFSGDEVSVEAIISELEDFKKLNNFSDEVALRTLTFALNGEASNWWARKKSNCSTWQDAVEDFRREFPEKIELGLVLEIVNKLKTRDVRDGDYIAEWQEVKAALVNMTKEKVIAGFFLSWIPQRIFTTLSENYKFSTLSEVEAALSEIEESSKKESKSPSQALKSARKLRFTLTSSDEKPQTMDPDDEYSEEPKQNLGTFCSKCRTTGYTTQTCPTCHQSPKAHLNPTSCPSGQSKTWADVTKNN